MAHDISKDYEKNLAFPHLAHLHIMIALYTPIRHLRRFARMFDRRTPTPPVQLREPAISANLEAASEHYKKHGWAFVENVFSQEIYDQLVKQFPKRRYMEPPKSIYKAYDIGFKWQLGRGEPRLIKLFPYFEALLGYLRSPEFDRRITAFAGSPHLLSCRSFLANRTYPGSLVIPHKDDPIPPQFSPYINMVFMLDGTGGENSGELILARDNAYQDIVFTPPTVKNACLIYNTDEPLYHGFKPVAFGKYRLAVTASFVSADYKGE